ncbi:MAG: RrF2 family transcriptional regulator [Candidatus Limnocylindrales bacterium]
MRLELTRRGDYGVRAMLALSAAHEDDPDRVTVREIAALMGVPVRILPSVMGRLAKADLVIATEGRAGGYVLARPMSSISLLTIIEAIEGDTRRQRCVLRGGPCGVGAVCTVHAVFARAEDKLRGELAEATLADVRIPVTPRSRKEE